jgi:hypothetical protein
MCQNLNSCYIKNDDCQAFDQCNITDECHINECRANACNTTNRCWEDDWCTINTCVVSNVDCGWCDWSQPPW